MSAPTCPTTEVTEWADVVLAIGLLCGLMVFILVLAWLVTK
jgi:hypothetical protein